MTSENINAGPGVIRTRSGLYLNLLTPSPEDITIEDIAHGLAHQCRFAGHTCVFYSVAQHSILAADMAPAADKLQALLHDASEAFLADIPRPVKPVLTNYKDIENNLMAVIAKKFGFAWPISDEVKIIDEALLRAEWDNLVITDNPKNLAVWQPRVAKLVFIETFKELTK